MKTFDQSDDAEDTVFDFFYPVRKPVSFRIYERRIVSKILPGSLLREYS